jgi:formylglycine-generating enzyme required for sulfatase activity
MSKFQVTQELYLEVMGSNPSACSSEPDAGEIQGKRPVECVSWYDALVFCNKLSAREGLTPVYIISGSTDPAVWGPVPLTNTNVAWEAVKMNTEANGYRLPTEGEWEYACRAGTTTAWYNSDTWTDNFGWVSDGAGTNGKTHQVGLKSANAWGLFDMHGNVFEWCWNWETWPDGTMAPADASYVTRRIIRGGAWNYNAQDARSASRYMAFPFGRNNVTGFRLVRGE